MLPVVTLWNNWPISFAYSTLYIALQLIQTSTILSTTILTNLLVLFTHPMLLPFQLAHSTVDTVTSYVQGLRIESTSLHPSVFDNLQNGAPSLRTESRGPSPLAFFHGAPAIQVSL